MPKPQRSPPPAAVPSGLTHQPKSLSESDLAGGSSDNCKPMDSNITVRNKRPRTDDSPRHIERDQYSNEVHNLKCELLDMLSSWKSDQDQRLTSWKAEQDLTLSALARDVNGLKTKCDQIQKTNTDIEASMDFVSQSYEEMKTRLAQLELEKAENTEHIRLLEQQVQDSHYRSRTASIELRNIPPKKDEKLEDLVSTLSKIGSTVSCDVVNADLRDIYRLPGPAGSVRPIVAEFAAVTKRTEFLGATRKYNKDRPKEDKLNSTSINLPGEKKPIYVDEHLTPAQKKLLYETRQWAQPQNFKSWHSNGKVFVKMNPDDNPIHIKSARCLSSLPKKL